MTMIKPKLLHNQAKQRLDYCAYNPKMIALIHSGVLVAGSLLTALLGLLLNHFVSNTGGLSGIGTRNILETANTLVQLAYLFASPFWQVGILFAFLCVARKQYAGHGALLQGFRRLGSVLSLFLFQLGLYILSVIAVTYAASFVVMPFSGKLMEMLIPVMEALEADPSADVTTLILQLPTKELLIAAWPLLAVAIAGYAAMVIFLTYRLRFAQYLILEDYRMGGFAAIRMSFRMTKGNCIGLFLLDLSFWKYYMLMVLITLISRTVDIILALKISLPISTSLFSLLTYCVYGAAILALDWWMRPMVETANALAYETVKNPPLAVVDQIQ